MNFALRIQRTVTLHLSWRFHDNNNKNNNNNNHNQQPFSISHRTNTERWCQPMLGDGVNWQHFHRTHKYSIWVPSHFTLSLPLVHHIFLKCNLIFQPALWRSLPRFTRSDLAGVCLFVDMNWLKLSAVHSSPRREPTWGLSSFIWRDSRQRTNTQAFNRLNTFDPPLRIFHITMDQAPTNSEGIYGGQVWSWRRAVAWQSRC